MKRTHCSYVFKCFVSYLFLVLGVISLVLSTFNFCQAADSDLSITPYPGSITLRSGEDVDVILIINNISSTTIENLTLSWNNLPGVSIKEDVIGNTNLLPGESKPIHVVFTKQDDTFLPGDFFIQVNYIKVQKSSDKVEKFNGATIVKVSLQNPTLEDVTKIAEVKIAVDSATIDEKHPGRFYLTIHNLIDMPITIENLTSKKGNLLSVNFEGFTKGMSVMPKTTRTIPFEVTMGDTTLTGTQKILIDMEISWIRGGRKETGLIQQSQDVNTSVIMASDILKAVGVPSFLFLPGFLLLSTVLILKKWVKQGEKPEKPDFTLPEYILLSISISMIAMLLYPAITGWLTKESRDYMQSYGLKDVLQVWFGSIGFGFVVWSLIFGLPSLGKRLFGSFMTQYRNPKENEQPIQILIRMNRNGVKWPLQECAIKHNGITSSCFNIIPAKSNQKLVWIAPSILCQKLPYKPNNNISLQDFIQTQKELQKEFDDAQQKDLQALISAMKKSKEFYLFVWGKEGNVSTPLNIPVEEIISYQPAQRSFVMT